MNEISSFSIQFAIANIHTNHLILNNIVAVSLNRRKCAEPNYVTKIVPPLPHKGQAISDFHFLTFMKKNVNGVFGDSPQIGKWDFFRNRIRNTMLLFLYETWAFWALRGYAKIGNGLVPTPYHMPPVMQTYLL